MIEVRPTFCRNCSAFCPVEVAFEDGRPVRVEGDRHPDAFAVYQGYTCPKGRALPEQYNDPRRLLRSQKRQADGSLASISSDQAIAEVSAELRRLIDEHGPRSVAFYFGSGILSTFFGVSMGAYLMQAIGSPMIFTPSTIDKPGEKVSLALHGNWHAGAQSFASSDVLILVGANPVIAKSNGAPYYNPGMRLKEAVNDGLKLIVIDPRRTETARRASFHLQPRPGEDAALLAGIINVVIREGLHDAAFVAENATGFEALRDAVAPFTPEYVAARADVPVEDFLAAARAFGQGRRGGVVCSTGASFSPHGNLTFYLALCLNTLCGRWAREGDPATYPNVLLPSYVPRAEPQAPFVAGGADLRVKGLKNCAAGMPTAGLPDEMLLEGEGQVKALICLGGNPMSSWPDQRKVEAGLRKLDLLVQFDVVMSPTAELAHYVIASPLAFEAPCTTYLAESMKYLGVSRGLELPWAQYTPALLPHPAGSDLIEEHEFLFRVAQQLGVQLKWINHHGNGPFVESPGQEGLFDMTQVPSLDELWEQITVASRVPLSEVRNYPHGRLFDVKVTVAGKGADCSDRLQLADPSMMAELAQVRDEEPDHAEADAFPFRLVSRRANNVMNSILVGLPGVARKGAPNPLYVHPEDLAELGVESGAMVSVRSRTGELRAIAEGDPTLRRGVVAITHGFGGRPGAQDDPRGAGANVNLLVDSDDYDPISGIPRMSGIAVAIEGVGATLTRQSAS